MISVLTLHNEVRFNINLLNSEYDQAVSSMDIDSALNRAKDYVIQNYSFLTEKSKFFEEALRELEVHDEPLIKVNDNSKYSVFKLPVKYYTYLSIGAVGSKGSCQAEIWNNYYKHTSKISLNDPNFEPSFLWRTGLYNIVGNGLHYYHNSDFDVNKLTLSYIKNLPDVQAPSLTNGGFYEKSDGSAVTEDKHLEISSTALWRKMTELAAYYILKSRVSTFQGTLEETLFHDSIGINVRI
jgi:hypothetical protein